VLRPVFLLALCVAATVATAAETELDRTPVEATTVKGEKVRLYPNGRWEYVNTQKQAEAQKVAEQYPENKTRPMDAQGCWLGFGRCVMPGDKDYNRGSLGRH
jgi:hypothetical protein